MKKVIRIISIVCLIIILFMVLTIVYALFKRDGNLAMGSILSLMLFSIMVWVILSVSKKFVDHRKDNCAKNGN